jgi:DNA invertase Pin-like site-specific DNA recombinase
MDRLARNVRTSQAREGEMNDRSVLVEFVKENMSCTAGSGDPCSTLMFTMLSAFARLSGRSSRKGRERSSLAKAEGTVYKGRKPALSAERITRMREQAAADKAGERI